MMSLNTQRSLYERIGGREGLALLLRHFYADVRQHELIGPIFNRQIDDWPSHLEKIGSFWARLTGGPSDYSGQMPAKHLNLGIDAQHFNAWLQLWRFNCSSHLKEPEAQEMIGLATKLDAGLRALSPPLRNRQRLPLRSRLNRSKVLIWPLCRQIFQLPFISYNDIFINDDPEPEANGQNNGVPIAGCQVAG
jgi:hemoglobin